ncbi:MAG: N-methyl-L-tryptophan oxidase [Chloroflexota bacterium]|nr:N-methyl-L-tryptophan oxidase [Chloroflexota bacterium]
MTHYDVIVLGGGTMGSAAAWSLAKRGARTLVLEQFSHVHPFGSHGGRTRVIRHAYAESPAYVPLVQRADDLWLELEHLAGEKILHRTGGLELAAPGYRHARAARESAQLHGLPHEWLTPQEANRRWDAVNVPEDWDVLFSPQAGFLLNEPALRSLARFAVRLGAELHEHEPARDWGATADEVWVRTDRETYRADRLVVTAGAWAASLLADLGLPLTVLRKVLFWLAVEDPAPLALGRFPVFIVDSDAGEIYGFPIHDHPGLKIAEHSGGQPTDPNTVDRTVRDEEKQSVVALSGRIFRGVTDRVLESTVCLYTMTPDTDFVVDRHPASPRVVLGAGFSGHGFKFATSVGELLAALALDEATEPYPHLALSRFGPARETGAEGGLQASARTPAAT